jgi:creatinine deaminase
MAKRGDDGNTGKSILSKQSSRRIDATKVRTPGPAEMQKFMREAINEAKAGLAEGGIPIGSVLVRHGEIIASGHNRRVQNGDPTSHAEIDCLRNAGRLKTFQDTILYSTLMPCAMCAGASVQFRIPVVVAGEDRTFPSAKELMQHNGIKTIDLNLEECYELMQQFAREHPQIWNEDIGEYGKD